MTLLAVRAPVAAVLERGEGQRCPPAAPTTSSILRDDAVIVSSAQQCQYCRACSCVDDESV